MKNTLTAVLLAGICAIPSFAAEKADKAQHFEANKAEVLKRIDLRLARIQEEKACVQAAASHEALRSCKDKFRAEIKQDRQSRKP